MTADKIGRKQVYIAGILGIALYVVPYFKLLDTQSIWGISLATLVGFGAL